ncbi:helix-turn-helix transcriptional regulator [Pseudomonas syringae group genomosp. 3]|uniref:HTH luxR-type domain-containing protein n=1 Tax=Pseudomonas syringae pv. persicae TaxID=237306 RepID=A0A3M4AVN7_9PSED|nr:hypothetical protein ALQ30_200569 [Pseudomonas syringae pv. persicae]
MAGTYSTVSKKTTHLISQAYWPIVEELFPELSPNEAKTVYLYTLGLSLRIIAGELAVSMNTVRTYLTRAKDKMVLNSLVEIRQICNGRISLQILYFITLSNH